MKTGLLMIIVTLLSVTVLMFGVMYDLTYTDDQEFRTDSMNPRISSVGEHAYVVWAEAKDSEFFDVYFRKITGGNLLDEPINLTQKKSFYPRPQVLASENSVYVLWEDRTDRHGYDGDTIYFKKSNNYGQTFDDAIVLGSSNSDSISYHLIDMTESNGIVYVFMLQSDPQIDETMAVFKASLDGGNTFGNPQPFLQFEEMTTSIRAISVNGIVYAIDSEVHGYSNESGEISFRKILSDGNISDVVNLSKTGYFVNHLDLAVSDDNVYVISVEITDELDSDGRIHEKRTLHFTKSHDGGNTFDVSKKLNIDSESEGVENQGARVFAYDNFVYVMWEEHYDDDGQDWHRKTWFARSDDNGQIFDVVAVHPLDTLHSKFGHVYAYEENKTLYFIVTSKINSFDEDSPIYFAKSDDGGLTISKIIDVAGKPLPIMDSPQVTIHDNHVQIVSDVLREKNCILHISSSDGGESFIESANLSPNGNLEDCLAK